MSHTLETWSGIQDVSWVPVLKNTIYLGSHYQVVPTEGYMAWEYNPLRNYRLSKHMYEKDGKYYTEAELCSKLTAIAGKEVVLKDSDGNLSEEKFKELYGEDAYNEFQIYTLHEPGELVDFITDELSFNISHPVDILPQYSYDGSINLILNDGLNIPRLINSRFTVTGKNTYKVIDRKGDNDTNIYDQGEQFDVDTSLFKNVNKIPKLEYLGTSTGNMSIGNYHFYFKYADADGNESDWVAESGLVSVFIGNTPNSVNTGIRDENSVKSVRFKLSNIDIGYSYVKVYYTRYTADVNSNYVVHAKRIDKNFLVSNSGTCSILITGDENETEVTLEEINSSFDVIQNAQTQCSAANRLFMANIHKTRVEYDKLTKLSLCFCPYKTEENYPLIDNGIDVNYNISANTDGYYDSEFIYNKTGYWPGELYRFGVVYILKDGSLSPVFNIRGATNVPTIQKEGNTTSIYYKVEHDFINSEVSEEEKLDYVLQEIEYSEDDFIIVGGQGKNENAKGVVQFSTDFYNSQQAFPIIGLNIRANKLVIEELKKYVKGFFFVRQKRIPLTLAQGIVIGLDKESRTPTLPTLAGVIDNINYNNSFVETSDINDINYVSEGFLSRYIFTLDKKDSGLFKKIATAIGVVVVLAAAVVATVFTCGAAAVALGVAIAPAFIAGTTAFAGLVTAVGIAAGASIAVAATAFGAQAVALKARQKRNKRAAQAVKGRNDDIPKGYERKEQDESRKIKHDLDERYIIKDPSKNVPDALIVPDYQVNQPYYNQFLTGDEFTISLTYEQPNTNYLNDGYFESDSRHFYVSGYNLQNDNRSSKVNLVGVPDGCPIKMIGEDKYCARAGYPEEAFQYEFQGVAYDDTENKKANSDIIRGNFGSFVGMKGYRGHACDQVNIMIPGYRENNLFEYVQLRTQDTSAFYAISDRIDINEINKKDTLLAESDYEAQDFDATYYRGDCYICQYTHRIIRNFNDPSAPYNDKIVDPNSWRDNYDPDNPESYAGINLGDVNAVKLGLWLTFQLRSSYNLNVRTIDKSNVDEAIMCGNNRSFYPNYGQLASGSQKIPDSDQYNKGFTKSVSEKYYFEVPDVPYIKQEFQNRIVFSDIHINDAYKNGFRVLRTMNHKDYPMTHGSITKLIELKNALLVVFEHGIGLISINNSAEHPSQILSDINIISDTYGSQWKDSIIKTPSGVYGVDTVAKKIWRVKEGQIELISDTRVQEFLNQNITLSERELTPILGIRNVKTVYNAFKHDILFTFYDNLHGIHEKSWNLCWNEILGIFTTFYSWIPSEMENIDNIPFSFNRDTVKAIGKLGVSDHGNDYSDGVTLSNNVIDVIDSGFTVNSINFEKFFINKQGIKEEFVISNMPDLPGFIGFLHLDNRTLPDNKVIYHITYELLRDSQGNHKLFEIKEVELEVKEVHELLKDTSTQYITAYYLALKPEVNPSELLSELYYRNSKGRVYADVDVNKIAPSNGKIHTNLPIFKNKLGKRIMLPKELQINPDKIVRYLNIKANVMIEANAEDGSYSATEAYYNQFANGDHNVCMIDAGYFESTVAVTTSFNLSLLSTDFWKHGQAGLIDITDKVYPTYWYGQQHPFEFECIVVDDPSVHKIFTNLEIVANKAKPESFHYEVVGDTYDFAEDKPTMYFRQEALKALYQYNGYDIEYNPNFLEIEPKQHNRSAELPKYYSRWDTINEVYDSYKRFSLQEGSEFSYDHLAGAEIVYYPTRNEFRVWNHAEAVDMDSLSQDLATSVIKANCRYLEDKWLVSINPIVITYKNELEYDLINGVKHFKINDLYTPLSDPKEESKYRSGLFAKDIYNVYKYSSWVKADEQGPFSGTLLPPINIQGTKIKEDFKGPIQIPNSKTGEGKGNALYGLYDLSEWDKGSWSPVENPRKISNANKDRRETDVRGKFMKVRIRYSGEELAIIDFLNTIYQISFA